MTSTIVHVSARCEDCEKLYRVPDPERTYTCKACGGKVHGEEEPAHPTDLEAAEELRHETLAALRRAYSWISSVTMMYRLGAIAYGVATLLAVLSLMEPDVPMGAGVLVVALTTLMTVMLLMGALHIQFMPKAWTLAIAVLATVVTVVHLAGANPFGVAFLGSAAWAGVAWGALGAASRFSKLISEHKDEYILHHASAQTRRALSGRSAEQRHERLLRAMRRAARRTWRISAVASAAIVLASILGTSQVLQKARPELFEPSLERFETAWNQGDLATITNLFEPSVRDVETARLTGYLNGHGWRPKPPNLPAGVEQRGQTSIAIDYEYDDLTLTTKWTRVGLEWSLVSVRLPMPAFEPTLDRFIAAWGESDPIKVVSFFAEDARSEMLGRIENSVELRGWTTWPAVQETQRGELLGNQTSVTLILSKGSVRTDWHYRIDGTWRLNGLKFPKR